jgi:hypothetical protein
MLDLSRSTLFDQAVTNQTATFRVQNQKKDSQNSHIVLSNPMGASRAGGHLVDSVKLDDAFSRASIYLAKIDVEGHEVNALEGALGLFRARSLQYVTVEFGDARKWARGGKTGVDAAAILKAIKASGYSLWILEMWMQPSTQFLQPMSPLFFKPAEKWPRRRISTSRVPPADAYLGPGGSRCPSTWCFLNAAGRVVGHDQVDHATITLIEIMDIDALMFGPVRAVDFNLFFERT